MNLPKVVERIRSIYRLTARKHQKDAERTFVKQKMNSSVNGGFFVPATPRRSRSLPKYVCSPDSHLSHVQRLEVTDICLCSRFAPDWVLGRDKLKEIVDPLRAIQMVANTLSIGL